MNKPQILWADDEIDLLRPYVIFLEQKGYRVVTTTNGQDAIDLCQTNIFDIVFLDENMPGLSGLETLSEIKAAHPVLPVVMITKSEEENIMNMAIGNKIADYLIKPVNPNQILLTLKKHIHNREIVSEHTTTTYRQEFSNIAYMINTASTLEEFMAIQRTLVHWKLELQEADISLQQMLKMQQNEANLMFAKFVKQHYEGWFEDTEKRPLMSPDLFKKELFPLLEQEEKLFFVVIDNFRYDQWKAIQTLLSDFFTVADEKLYCSILPTATQYARNAIFSGLMPLQIKEMFPNLWVDEEDEEGKNLVEDKLIDTQLKRFRKDHTFSYHKVNESDFCERLNAKLPRLETKLNVIVLNFIDMLSHSRTESKMMRELANDEAAYLSLTKSWFKHSATYELFKTMARLGYKVVVTTDHGTVQVNNPTKIIGDKSTNVNLRYKVGKTLTYAKKEVFELLQPKRVGLPVPNISSIYVFATGSDFFAYPNQYNHYVSYYKETFQHGGVSLEEMLIPFVVLEPKRNK